MSTPPQVNQPDARRANDWRTPEIHHPNPSGSPFRRFAGGLTGVLTALAFGLAAMPSATAALKVWYKFDETTGTAVADASGNGFNGAVNGSYTWTPGKFGNCYATTGGGNFIRVPDLGTFPNGFTLSCWVQDRSTADWQCLFANDSWAANAVNIDIRSYTNTYQWLFSVNGATGADQFGANKYGVINQYEWHHIAFVYNTTAKTIDFYIDGVKSSTNTYAGTVTPSMTGLRIASFGGNRPFVGRLDDFRIYDTALVATEVQAAMNYQTQNAITGTVTSGGSNVAGAAVSYSRTSGQAISAPEGQVYTAADGTYTISVADNTGPWYIAAGKTGYVNSSEYSPAPSVTTADIPGINLSLTKLPVISGYVKVGGTGLSGATVYLKQSANADLSPAYTLTTDANGFYSQYVNQNSGTWYAAATKTGYSLVRDNASQPNITTTDSQFPDLTLTLLPTISGTVSDTGGNLYNAAVSVSTNADGSSPGQTVYANTSGVYTASVNPNTTYYLICKKSAHADSSVTSVAVVTTNVTQNFAMTRNTAAKLVDIDAGGLTVGSHTAADIWANGGSMGGSFTATGAYTVLAAGSAGGRQSVNFASSLRFTSSWTTSAAAWPSAIAGPDVQYTTVAWVYAPASTGTYLSWANGTGAARGTISYNSSNMYYRYNNGVAWGACDHGSSTWVGWTGTNTNSGGSCPAFGSWHMIVNTYDGLAEKLYVDNVKQSTTAADAVNRTFNPNSNNMRVGCDFGSDYFTGYVNKVQVYDQALDAATITSLWNAGNATNYTIAGQVTSSGAGVSGATVTVYSDAGCTTVLNTATTDSSGNYTTPGVPQSTTYYLKAVKTGYVTSSALTVNLGTSNSTGANFTLNVIPNATITGQVTESGTGTPLAGAKVYVSASTNASATPAQVLTADGSGNYSAVVAGGTWYVCASQDTHKTSADITINNIDGSAQTNKNIALVADTGNNIPQKSSLLFSVLSESLPTSQGADTGNWALYQPLGGSLAKQNTPTVDVLGGKSFAMNHVSSADSFGFGSIAQGTSLPINGASIVTVVKPIRTGAVSNYQPVVSVLLGQLELCINNGDGLLRVGRKGSDAPNLGSSYYFADSVEHIVSYIVQPNGYFQVYVDGTSVWNYTASTADMTSITAQTWYATQINVGKGFGNDGWSSFNGDIGDTFVYKAALTDSDRIALETSLGTKFGITVPVYHTLTVSAGTGGSITPSGSLTVTDGSSQTFAIAPNTGYRISDVTLDGVSQGTVTSLTLNNITANHTVVASFAVVPQHTISGTVTAAVGGAPISGATVYISQTANAFLGTPAYTATTDGSGNWSKVVYDGAYYVCAGATNCYYTADQALAVSANTPGINFALRSSVRNIPQTSSLLFGAVTDSLPNSGTTGTWTPLYTTGGNTLAVLAGTPSTAIVGGVKWVANSYASGDGYRFGGSYWDATGQHPIACTGASIVAVVAPTRSAASPWNEIVDIFYSTLGLCVKNDTGEILVRRNPAGSMFGTGYIIPDGQKTIISLVVQPTGQFVVFANGIQVYANTSTTDVTSLIPGTTQYAGGNAQGGFGTFIDIGRNNPDSWTSYNGKIGDVFVYTTALGQADRLQLEADLANKFAVTLPVYHTITASAGSNGTISPSGSFAVVHGSNQAFTITPDSGYLVQNVLVDGSSVGAVTSYTFTNVTGNHTITASMAATPYNIWSNGAFTNAFTDKDPTHNPDGDSLTNLQEFAFGTDPTTANNGTIAYTGTLLTACGPPVAQDLSPGTGGVDYRAVFCRRKNWQAEGLTYTVQFSADLDFTPGNSQTVTVTAQTATVLATDAADVMEAVSVPYPLFIPVTGGYRKPTFFRVGVTSN